MLLMRLKHHICIYDITGKKVGVEPTDPVLGAYDFNGNCKIDLGAIAELASQ